MSGFDNIFRELRIQHCKTQTEVAKTLGISRSTVSMYECGEREPDLATLKKISLYYGVDMNYLLGQSSNISASSEKASTQNLPFDALQSLIARNGKQLSLKQKQDLIRLLLTEESGETDE